MSAKLKSTSRRNVYPMARKPEMPRINTVTVAFNGNREAFENFMNSIITDYLNSTGEADFIENVELSVESA